MSSNYVILGFVVFTSACVCMCYLENLEFAMNVKHFSAPARESRWIGSKQNIGSIILSLKKKTIYIFNFFKEEEGKAPSGEFAY